MVAFLSYKSTFCRRIPHFYYLVCFGPLRLQMQIALQKLCAKLAIFNCRRRRFCSCKLLLFHKTVGFLVIQIVNGWIFTEWEHSRWFRARNIAYNRQLPSRAFSGDTVRLGHLGMEVPYRLRWPSRAFSQFFKHLNSIISRTVRFHNTGNISFDSCAAYEFANLDWILG